MKRSWLRVAVIAAALAGCSASRDSAPPSGAARIHNAIDFGLASSTYVVVAKVDGVSVHRKFDRDPYVEVEAGRRRIDVRFYSESMTASRSGLESCSLELDAESGGSYYLEGGVAKSQWRARIVDATGAAIACVFPGGATHGAIAGGEQEVAVSASPPSAAPVPSAAAAPPRAAPIAKPSTELPPAVVAAPAAPVASAVAAPPSAPIPNPPTELPPAVVAAPDVPAREPEPPKIDKSATPAERASSDEEFFVISAMRGRGHRGCAAGRFLVDEVSGDALSLTGNERVRLLGVIPARSGGRTDAAYTEALRSVVGRCVEIELDGDLGERGHHDREGNLRAYVKAEDGVLLNAEVLRLGVATIDTGWRGRYMAELLAAQAAAD